MKVEKYDNVWFERHQHALRSDLMTSIEREPESRSPPKAEVKRAT